MTPVSPACEPSPFADRRASPRVAVALPAFVRVGEERHAVQLLDLSSGGAKLDCPRDLAVGGAIALDLGALSRAAVVRWTSAGFVGVSFDVELEAKDIEVVVERSRALAQWRRSRK